MRVIHGTGDSLSTHIHTLHTTHTHTLHTILHTHTQHAPGEEGPLRVPPPQQDEVELLRLLPVLRLELHPPVCVYGMYVCVYVCVNVSPCHRLIGIYAYTPSHTYTYTSVNTPRHDRGEIDKNNRKKRTRRPPGSSCPSGTARSGACTPGPVLYERRRRWWGKRVCDGVLCLCCWDINVICVMHK